MKLAVLRGGRGEGLGNLFSSSQTVSTPSSQGAFFACPVYTVMRVWVRAGKNRFPVGQAEMKPVFLSGPIVVNLRD